MYLSNKMMTTMITQASRRTENTVAYSSTTSSESPPEVAGPTVEVGVASGGTGMQRMVCQSLREN